MYVHATVCARARRPFRTVGIPTGIAAQLVLDGTIKRKGVLQPVHKDVYLPILEKYVVHPCRWSDFVASPCFTTQTLEIVLPLLFVLLVCTGMNCLHYAADGENRCKMIRLENEEKIIMTDEVFQVDA